MALSTRAAERLDRFKSKTSPFPAPNGPYFDPELHLDGVINLSTAENSLLSSEILPIIHQATVRAQHLKYRTTLLRSSITQLAELLPAYVNRQNPVRKVTRANSVPGPGVGALLAHLVWTLCDPGDGVLMTAPYYHDYERDIIYPAGAVPVLAHVPATGDSFSMEAISLLRQRAKISAAEGVPIKCILLCNPHNPLAQCYPFQTIEGYINLAAELRVHLIVDEIFANSVFCTTLDPTPVPFTSVLSLPAWSASSPMLNNIHVLAGPTKDLGCSALKAALLVTENAEVRRSVETALNATPISGVADAAVSELLRDEKRLDGLLAKNKKELGWAMDLCAAWASYHKLSFVSATAGVYFILDLSRVVKTLGLSKDPVEATAQLMKRMIAHRVHINPTSVLDADPLPHRFRFIFTQQDSTLRLAFQRLEASFDLPPWPQA